MRGKSSSCSAVYSESYLTESSARHILDSQTQHLILLANHFLAFGLKPAWFATILLLESGVKQPAVFRRCVEVPALGINTGHTRFVIDFIHCFPLGFIEVIQQ